MKIEGSIREASPEKKDTKKTKTAKQEPSKSLAFEHRFKEEKASAGDQALPSKPEGTDKVA
jgi:hypothetical protein